MKKNLIAFGLCDLGMDFPELGSISLQELKEIRAFGIFKVEKDLHFTAKYPLSVYFQAALAAGRITLNNFILAKYCSFRD